MKPIKLFFLATVIFILNTNTNCNNDSNHKKNDTAIGSDKHSSDIILDSTKTCKLDLRFKDNLTGHKILPQKITFKNLKTSKDQSWKLSDSALNKDNLFYELPYGEYELSIDADNYIQNLTKLNVNTNAIEITFEMEPLPTVKQDLNKYIQTLHSNKTMVIYGYVIDDLYNQPISSVEVYTMDKKASDKTNEQGFFKLLIPLPNKKEKVDERNSIVFSKEGFNKSIWQKFDMYPYGDLGFKVRLKKGKSIDTVIVQKDKAVEIVFID